jgi:hypothetical protein
MGLGTDCCTSTRRFVLEPACYHRTKLHHGRSGTASYAEIEPIIALLKNMAAQKPYFDNYIVTQLWRDYSIHETEPERLLEDCNTTGTYCNSTKYNARLLSF